MCVHLCVHVCVRMRVHECVCGRVCQSKVYACGCAHIYAHVRAPASAKIHSDFVCVDLRNNFFFKVG